MMVPMLHLGPRVTALVDGRLSEAEEARAWAHVDACPLCHAAVVREGWIKRELTCLSLAGAKPSENLKGVLSAGFASYPRTLPETQPEGTGHRVAALAALGAGTLGAAMFALLVVSVAPAQAPATDRRAPATSLVRAPVSPDVERGTGRRDGNDTVDDTVADVVDEVVRRWARMGL